MPAVQPVADPQAVRWFADRLRPWGSHELGSTVPEGFEAYARLLHPPSGFGSGTRWSDVAVWSGRELTPTSNFDDLATRPNGERWPDGPSEELERELCGLLATALAPFTQTPDRCWYAIWYGYGGLELDQPAIEITQRITDSGRRYFVFRGPVDAVTELEFELTGPGVGRIYLEGPGPAPDEEAPIVSYQAPNFWWPDDRAWFVSCEIDGPSTYIGGSEALIEQLLSYPRLEVLPASLDDPFEGVGTRG